ncbi:hypothetical protein HDU92_006159 [Lobulomyces angularis]|nr:hypothetical protein HDU92_006159 [Lobulomyces angularis]
MVKNISNGSNPNDFILIQIINAVGNFFNSRINSTGQDVLVQYALMGIDEILRKKSRKRAEEARKAELEEIDKNNLRSNREFDDSRSNYTVSVKTSRSPSGRQTAPPMGLKIGPTLPNVRLSILPIPDLKLGNYYPENSVVSNANYQYQNYPAFNVGGVHNSFPVEEATLYSQNKNYQNLNALHDYESNFAVQRFGDDTSNNQKNNTYANSMQPQLINHSASLRSPGRSVPYHSVKSNLSDLEQNNYYSNSSQALLEKQQSFPSSSSSDVQKITPSPPKLNNSISSNYNTNNLSAVAFYGQNDYQQLHQFNYGNVKGNNKLKSGSSSSLNYNSNASLDDFHSLSGQK